MRLAEITEGAEVYVTRGYSRRPAVVRGVADGKVSVSFTDVPADLRLPAGHAGNLYGATVRPNAVEPRPAALSPDLADKRADALALIEIARG